MVMVIWHGEENQAPDRSQKGNTGWISKWRMWGGSHNENGNLAFARVRDNSHILVRWGNGAAYRLIVSPSP